VVFTAPTIDWAEGLNDPQVGLITKNVIEKLKTRGQSSSSSSSEPSQSTTTTSGGGGSLPISGLLLGLLAIFRLKPRKQ
jgi:hypothetical protein